MSVLSLLSAHGSTASCRSLSRSLSISVSASSAGAAAGISVNAACPGSTGLLCASATDWPAWVQGRRAARSPAVACVLAAFDFPLINQKSSSAEQLACLVAIAVRPRWKSCVHDALATLAAHAHSSMPGRPRAWLLADAVAHARTELSATPCAGAPGCALPPGCGCALASGVAVELSLPGAYAEAARGRCTHGAALCGKARTLLPCGAAWMPGDGRGF